MERAKYVKCNPDKEGKFKLITWNENKKTCDIIYREKERGGEK